MKRVMYGVDFGGGDWLRNPGQKKRALFDSRGEAMEAAEEEGGEVKEVRVPGIKKLMPVDTGHARRSVLAEDAARVVRQAEALGGKIERGRIVNYFREISRSQKVSEAHQKMAVIYACIIERGGHWK